MSHLPYTPEIRDLAQAIKFVEDCDYDEIWDLENDQSSQAYIKLTSLMDTTGPEADEIIERAIQTVLTPRNL